MNKSGQKANVSGINERQERIVRFVMLEIERLQLGRYRLRMAAFGTLALASLVALVPAGSYFASTVGRSGLVSYLSLASSDGSYLLNNFGDWAMSVAMTLPVTGMIAVLTACLALAASLRFIGKYLSSSEVCRERLTSLASA